MAHLVPTPTQGCICLLGANIANPQPANEDWGVSGLRDVIGINRALNERLWDEADLIRYLADPPVVFQGDANTHR